MFFHFVPQHLAAQSPKSAAVPQIFHAMAWMRRSLCAAVLTAIARGGPEAYGHGGGHGGHGGGHGGHDGHGHTDGPRYKPEMMDFAGSFFWKKFG